MARDKEKAKAYAKRHYQQNKHSYIQSAKAHNLKAKQRNKQYILDYKLQHPCLDCGETNPIVLEFDHISDNKVDSVVQLALKPCSLNTLIKEIKKCEVVCANCHRIRTHNRRK